MQSFKVAEIESREVIPGYYARVIHSGYMTFVYWDVDTGASLPEHSHPHEQVAHILEGRFELTVDNFIHTYAAGEVVIIPPYAVHSGKALTRCRIMDTFYPVREDYK